ncbi:MAG TPA: thioredoxin family protein [Ktedonobacterales bacterium]
MAVTGERFAQGMSYDEFKQQMTRNRERLEANELSVQLRPEDLAAFKNLPQPLDVLVLAEDWCADVIDNLPVLERIAEESGKLNLRIFLRDQHPDLMDQFLNQGQFRSIPVFAFFDGQFNEIGHFIERPQSVTARRAELRREIHARHPEFGSPETPITQVPEDVRPQLMVAITERREETKQQDNQDVVTALREIVERVPAA